MSKMVRTSGKKQKYKRAVSRDKSKSSTPCHNIPVKRYNISLSEIDTASSSSGDRYGKLILFTSGKRKKGQTEKRRLNKKKKVVVESKDTDREWKTESEESINESRINTRESTPKKYQGCHNLFEDLPSPEKTRDAQIENESLYGSLVLNVSRRRTILKKDILQENESLPVINLPLVSGSPVLSLSRRRIILKKDDNPQENESLPMIISPSVYGSPVLSLSRRCIILKKDDNPQENESLPVINLPSVTTRNVHPEETDDKDELTFYYENNMKTYPPSRWKKTPKKKFENYISSRFLNATSNLLWDKFIGKNSGDISQNVELLSTQIPVKSMVYELPDIINPLPPGMEIIRKYWDKALQKWISYTDTDPTKSDKNNLKINNKTRIQKRKRSKKEKRKIETITLRSPKRQRTAVYDRVDETDNEFETGGQNGK